MAQRKAKVFESDKFLPSVSIIDLLLIDHKFIKECIALFKQDEEGKGKSVSKAKEFLEAVQLHSEAEKKVVYVPMEKNEELHFNILEAEIEHGIIDRKVKLLKGKLLRARVLKDEIEVELKVLADLLEKHLLEEESDIFPRMIAEVDEDTLLEMGKAFTKIRKFTPEEVHQHIVLQNELIQWRDSVQEISNKLLSKMDQYVEGLKH